MKIVQINATYNISSTGRICKAISDYALKKGHSVVNFFNDGEEDDHSFKFGNKIDSKIHALLSRLTGLQGYYSKVVTMRLIKRIQAFNPDVCILHNLHCNSINFNMLFSFLKKNNILIVLYLHDCFFFTGKCTYYSNVGCEQWKNHCGKCPLLKHDNPSWFFDTTKKTFLNKQRLYKNARIVVVGVSDWITNESLSSRLLSNFKTKRVYNWVDLGVFKNESSSFRKKFNLKFPDKKLILGVSVSWSQEKGLNEYIELSKILPENYKIVLIGHKPSNVHVNNIYFYGSVDSTIELADIYNAADVYLNLSKQETFGLVSAEAISCGTPVIAYSLTACPELVGTGCGEVIQYSESSLDTVKEKIIKIVSRGKQYYKDKCIEFARNTFNKDINIADLLSFIEEEINCDL